MIIKFITLYTQNESIARTKMIKNIVEFIGNISKKPGTNNAQLIKPINIVKNKDPLNQVNGVHILYKYNKPVIVVIYILIVLCILYWRSNSAEKAETKATLNITVRAVGKALANIFNKKFPLTKSLFGSRASMKEGAPIVNVVINVRLIGLNQYF